MTPADYGFAQCTRCGTQRPAKLLASGACLDVEGCARWLAARVGGPFLPHARSPVLFTDGVNVNETSAPTGLDANGDAL